MNKRNIKKANFLALANAGVVEVEGVKLEIEIKPDAEGLDFIKIKMHPITSLHDSTFIAYKWLKYTYKIEYIDKDKKTFYALGCFSLDLDGVIYLPRWSYWQARPYYKIKAGHTENKGGL